MKTKLKSLQFIKFEWKQFVRSAAFSKSIASTVLLFFVALYFIVCFLFIGVAIFFFLKDIVPGKDPLVTLNGYIGFIIVLQMIIRYMIQKLPVIRVKPFLHLSLKKSSLVNYVLLKSIFSFFNILWLFFLVPFAIVLCEQDYSAIGVISWVFNMFLILLCTNYINFLINRNIYILTVLVLFLGTLIGLQKFNIYDFTFLSESLFYCFYQTPAFGLFTSVILVLLYLFAFKELSNLLYLDKAITIKTKSGGSLNLSFMDNFGSSAPFLKNEIRLIWRNKRARTTLLSMVLFLFYGFLFFDPDKESSLLYMFCGIFVTNGFSMSYGQFIPAWDSSYYKLFMTQNFSYRDLVNSKWMLVSSVVLMLYFLSIPYLFMGLKEFLFITAGMIYNLGITVFILLYAGAYNRKPININASGFANYEGTSAAQFLVIIPIMVLPLCTFWVFNFFFNYYVGLIAVSSIGILGLLFKNTMLKGITKEYVNKKYKTIAAFSEK